MEVTDFSLSRADALVVIRYPAIIHADAEEQGKDDHVCEIDGEPDEDRRGGRDPHRNVAPRVQDADRRLANADRYQPCAQRVRSGIQDMDLKQAPIRHTELMTEYGGIER